jgi:hypothetical protein
LKGKAADQDGSGRVSREVASVCIRVHLWFSWV